MKKPNFKAWARREMRRIKDDSKDLKAGDAYFRAGRLSRELGKRYSKIGKHDKASKQYQQSAAAYERLGNSNEQYKMQRLAEEESSKAEGLEGISKTSGLTASIILLVVGLLFLSLRFTGYSISVLNETNSGSISIVFFILSLIGFYFIIRKF